MTTIALRAIIDANLSAATERAAIRLLSLAHPDTGQVNLTQRTYLDLTGCSSLGAARKHLTTLQAAGIIHYSTNEHVYITFLAWAPLDDLSAPTRPPQRVYAPIPAPAPTAPTPPAPSPARPRAPQSAPTRPNAPLPHTRVLVEEDPNPSRNDPIHHHPLPPELEFDVIAAGINPKLLAVHPSLTLAQTRAIIRNWRQENAHGAAGPGALHYRLKHTWSDQPDPRFIPASAKQKDYSAGLPPGYEEELRHVLRQRQEENPTHA